MGFFLSELSYYDVRTPNHMKRPQMVILVYIQEHLPAWEATTLDICPVHPSDNSSANWHLISGHGETSGKRCLPEPRQPQIWKK